MHGGKFSDQGKSKTSQSALKFSASLGKDGVASCIYLQYEQSDRLDTLEYAARHANLQVIASAFIAGDSVSSDKRGGDYLQICMWYRVLS